MLPLQAVWSQVFRQTYGGDVLGPEQRIGVMDALRAVTIDAAWQVFQEDNRGSLEPGKYADLVVLSGNPLDDPMAMRDVAGGADDDRRRDNLSPALKPAGAGLVLIKISAIFARLAAAQRLSRR